MFSACSAILTAVVVLLSSAARKAKLPITHRILHIRYVIFTIIFSIVSVSSFSKILSLINLILSLPVIRNILYYFVPLGNLAAGFYWIIALISCIFLMLAYCISIHFLKITWLKPLSKTNYLAPSSLVGKIYNEIAGYFYEIRTSGC